MKFRPLPATDFANIAVKRTADQWIELNRMQSSYAPFSYEPTRRNLGALLNSTLPLFEQFSPENYKKTRRAIARACKRGKHERIANLTICDAIADFVVANEVTARSEAISSVRIGAHDKLSYASPFILNYLSRPFLVFPDFRKSSRLTKAGCDFVFAINHHFIVEQDPYFAGVGMMALQFGEGDGKRRVARPIVFDDVPKYGVSDLEDMVRTTNRIWSRIQVERTKAA
ncbi:hypothetical protein [Thalassococcus sp. S3]|uniref:hypothetical protein n=1 Tax=Thalassococcus sp. S3 TaxID=2017482 RepID=UPI00102AC733|nr:hypothetical protein [Thalassococcus sp. S3]